MKAVKMILIVMIYVFLFPAGMLWIAGSGRNAESFVQAWRAFMAEFLASRGVATLAAGISMAVYYEIINGFVVTRSVCLPQG